MLAGVAIPEGLTGAGRSSSKMDGLRERELPFFAGCWQEVFVPYHLALSIGLFVCPCNIRPTSRLTS